MVTRPRRDGHVSGDADRLMKATDLWDRHDGTIARRPDRSERVSTDRAPPCAPSLKEPVWNARHGLGPG